MKNKFFLLSAPGLMAAVIFLLSGCNSRPSELIKDTADIAYFKQGAIAGKDSDVPFVINGKALDQGIVEAPIFIKIVDTNKIYFDFSAEGREYEFWIKPDTVISNHYFSMSITLKKNQEEEDMRGIYYFKFKKHMPAK